MKLSVGLKVSNTLSLTPQLQQAIRLLQLSSLELEQEIQLQLESNPLLEKIDEDFSSIQAEEEKDNSLQEGFSGEIPEVLPVDTQWDDIYTHQPTGLAMPEYEEREDNRILSENLSEHILWQVNLLHLSEVEKVIAYCIVDALDERGYLASSLEEVLAAAQHVLAQTNHASVEVELDEVQVVLKHIQHLDPVGIAARDLVECLSLQLDALSGKSPIKEYAQQLLSHADLLLANDINRLMKQTHLSLEQLKQALQLLKSLDPTPGAQFQAKDQDYQIPDVVVQKKQQQWHIFLNPDVVPKLRVNPYYAGMIRRSDQSDDNQYLRTHMLEAKNFIKGIEERHKTLLRVTTCIVEHQKAFFEIGPEGMKPLVLREIAEELDLHESTISRVTTNKYMLTPRGLFELKYFFSSHVATAEGGECSSTAIRAMIKKIIAGENPKKPYSDNKIAQLLQDDGIDVARRTVAKYRESLHIPASSERKVLL